MKVNGEYPVTRFGDCVAAAARIKQIFASCGVQGNYIQLQNKQALTASILVEGDGDSTSLIMHNKAANRKLLKELLPHKDPAKRRNWINECVRLRSEFELDPSKGLNKKYNDLHRES